MGTNKEILPLDIYARVHPNDKRGMKKARKMWRRGKRKGSV